MKNGFFEISFDSGISRETLLDLIEQKICHVFENQGTSVLLGWCYQLDIDEELIPKLNAQNIKNESKKLSQHILRRLEQKRQTRQD